ncbi:hypothetical protein Leryth_016637 [Lithospermum erythrorhizon]|nr:hypothetical protein Leryth_016637 [Lithospermum erythrorhizon]
MKSQGSYTFVGMGFKALCLMYQLSLFCENEDGSRFPTQLQKLKVVDDLLISNDHQEYEKMKDLYNNSIYCYALIVLNLRFWPL